MERKGEGTIGFHTAPYYTYSNYRSCRNLRSDIRQLAEYHQLMRDVHHKCVEEYFYSVADARCSLPCFHVLTYYLSKIVPCSCS